MLEFCATKEGNKERVKKEKSVMPESTGKKTDQSRSPFNNAFAKVRVN